MRFFKKRIFFLLIFLKLGIVFSQVQDKFIIHSHNDYLQNIPFWTAYSNELNSIEADIFLEGDALKVAHTINEIKSEKTLENLYLKPLSEVLKNNIGKIKKLHLLLDIKSEAIPTLNKIINVLEEYPKIINHPNIKIIISGSQPSSVDYKNYPDFIYFDYQNINKKISLENLKKVGMVSASFKDFSKWNGKGRLTHEDYDRVDSIIKIGKSFNKPFRFWGTPDSKTAWRTFLDFGVDVINTDQPGKCSEYLNNILKNRKTVKLQSEIYKPNFKSDQIKKKVKNIILMIGDGNGLSQISAAVLANNGELTLTQLKSIGFIKTQSADDFTTDSAAAGTAISTGQKTNNRSIGTDINRKPIQTISEILFDKGYKTGIITTDEIIGATPASFYAHQFDRSMSKEIASDLLVSKLHFFAGGGASVFKNLNISDTFNIIPLSKIKEAKADKIGVFFSENGVPSIIGGRKNVLAEATSMGVNFLNKNKAPFFLMVEAAQIDSFGHINDTNGIITETIDFDKAITQAIKFADSNKETLVIITADHETSGFSVSSGNISTHTIEGDFITYDHTATMVPVFAYGPQSNEFQGVYENNELFSKIIKVLNK